MKNKIKKFLAFLFHLFSKIPIIPRILDLVIQNQLEKSELVEHAGIQLRFASSNTMAHDRNRTFSIKEPETLEWIDNIPKHSLFWDIGANVGLYSCYAARKTGCKVIAFEPSVFNLELLARNIWLNQLVNEVTVFPLPLADKVSINTLNMSMTDWGGSMSTFKETYTHDGTPLKAVFGYSMVGIDIDSMVRFLRLDQPAYIKIDVDGIEHLILKGAAKTLKKVKGLLVEVNEDFPEQAKLCEKYLRAAGLRLIKKAHAPMFDNTALQNCYNQIWAR